MSLCINKTPPTSVAEIRKFLGAVQFYRRFVPRIALLAAPTVCMNALLKKFRPPGPKPGTFLKPGTPEYARAVKADPRFRKGSPENLEAFDRRCETIIPGNHDVPSFLPTELRRGERT